MDTTAVIKRMTRIAALLVAVFALCFNCKKEVVLEQKEKSALLKEGDQAPDFSAASSAGGEVTLRSLRGKLIVLYFYPKDNTPGCTREAGSFRDTQAELKQLGVTLLGVSRDSLTSHQQFIEKQSLNFPLLSDPDGKIISAYQAWKDPSAPNKGVNRSTILIDQRGVIRHIWRAVKVDNHVGEVLAAIKALPHD
jgi:thioredoxin-dependent peroxiredoxin